MLSTGRRCHLDVVLTEDVLLFCSKFSILRQLMSINLIMDCNIMPIISTYIKTEPVDDYGDVPIQEEVTDDTPTTETASGKEYRRYRCKIGDCKEVCLTLNGAIEHRRTHVSKSGSEEPITGAKKKRLPRRVSAVPGFLPEYATRTAFRCAFDGCSSVFRRKYELRQHNMTHTGERPFRCAVKGCKKRFRSKGWLGIHQFSHTGERRFPCKYDGCKSRFKTRFGVRQHMKALHPGTVILKCGFKRCRRIFMDRLELENHRLVHTRGSPYPCILKDCNRRFASPAGLGCHLKTHEGTTPYKCTFVKCDKWFPDKGTMEEHVVSHAGGREFECDAPGCGRRYFDTWLMEQHMLEHPEGFCRPFSCTAEGCGTRFCSFIALKKHSSRYKGHGKGPPIRKARSCRKALQSERQLRAQEQQMVYECHLDGCSMRFGSSVELDLHLQSPHGDKVYKCNVFGCRIMSTSVLFMEQHGDSHPGGFCQPFRCDNESCDKRYSKFESLQEHAKDCRSQGTKPEVERPKVKKGKVKMPAVMNPEEIKPKVKRPKVKEQKVMEPEGTEWPCVFEGCDRVFNTKKDLTVHSMMHEYVTKYNYCMFNGCTRRFVKEKDFDEHLARHQKEQDNVSDV